MRTIWILPGWFGFIFGSSPSGYQQTDMVSHAKAIVKNLMTVVKTWQERQRQRIHLSELSDERLRDLGLTRDQVEWEISKHFWQR